jgi:hypothetical protein
MRRLALLALLFGVAAAAHAQLSPLIAARFGFFVRADV